MIKISVTNKEFYFKNYLIFTKNLKNSLLLVSILKNKEKKVYSTFVTVTVILSLLLSTTHSTTSPALTSIIWAIGAGKVVLTELLLLVPFVILVFCLNIITITSYLFVVIHILVTLDINILSFSNTTKKVTFIY